MSGNAILVTQYISTMDRLLALDICEESESRDELIDELNMVYGLLGGVAVEEKQITIEEFIQIGKA